jgi:hypothetical protein
MGAEGEEVLVAGHDVVGRALSEQAMVMSSLGSRTTPLTGGRPAITVVVV